jgi:hypothetical protein
LGIVVVCSESSAESSSGEGCGDNELSVLNGAGWSFVVSGKECASDVRALIRGAGRILPRRPARDRMPAAAFALK